MIQEAIKSKKKLKMVYLKANDTKSARQVIPLFVGKEEFKGKSYIGMRGICLNSHEERMFRVDRILELDMAT